MKASELTLSDWSALRSEPWLGELDRQLGTLMASLAAEQGAWLAIATALASRAASGGQVYLDLRQNPGIQQPWPTLEQWRSKLMASLLVGGPGSCHPLILDAAGRLYIRRFHCYQQTLAADLHRRAGLLPRRFNQARFQLTLDRLDAMGGILAGRAARILGTVALCRVTVVQAAAETWPSLISGLLAVLTEQLGRRLSMLLSGPVGQQSRQEELLQRVYEEPILQAADGCLLPREPLDLNALLQSSGAMGELAEAPPLQADLLVVVGAESVDLATLARLVGLLAPYTRLVLLGDQQQAPQGKCLPFAALLAGPGQSRPFRQRLASIVEENLPEGVQTYGPLQESLVQRVAPAVLPNDGLYDAFWVESWGRSSKSGGVSDR